MRMTMLSVVAMGRSWRLTDDRQPNRGIDAARPWPDVTPAAGRWKDHDWPIDEGRARERRQRASRQIAWMPNRPLRSYERKTDTGQQRHFSRGKRQ